MEPAEILGVVGESGSGKTTLGRAILEPAPVTSGTVERKWQRAGLVHQDPFASLDPRWNIARIITEPLVISGELTSGIRQRAVELLDAVRLTADIADRKPRELSGGQRQRIALARALASRPELIVADEPTSALDVSVQAAVLELWSELQQDLGFAGIFITHEVAVVSEITDRVAVLRHGELVEYGTVDDVFGAPKQDYTQRLLAAVPTPEPDRPAKETR